MATNAAGELVGMLFGARNIAHTVHFKTTSYSEHKTLDEFYNGIIPLVDDFVEAYQGRYGVRMDIPTVPNKYKGTISEVLRAQMEWIEANRQGICPRTETALHNIIDEIVALYQSTLFLLTLK